MPSKPATISEALAHATRYWETNERRDARGPNMMPIRAGRCADILGRSRKVSSLSPADGTKLLGKLREGGLARSSVASYYSAGKRMLALAGVSCVGWPKAPTVPRKVRKPTLKDEVDSLVEALRERGWNDTANLILFMWYTGARVDVEALRRGAWETTPRGTILFTGKGGHQREVPVTVPQLASAFQGLTYEGHLRRIKATGTPLRPHDLRRAFVKRAYEGSGKDIRVAQVLAGHSDPGTTAGYIGVDMAELRRALA